MGTWIRRLVAIKPMPTPTRGSTQFFHMAKPIAVISKIVPMMAMATPTPPGAD